MTQRGFKSRGTQILLLAAAVLIVGVATAWATTTLIRVSTTVPYAAPGTHSSPTASFEQLVWLRTSSADASATREIRWKNMQSGETTVLASVSRVTGDLGAPSTHDKKVVYAKRVASSEPSATAGWDVFLHDLVTGAESRLTTSAADQTRPDVYGNWVVYEDNRNGNQDIYLHDLRDGSETRLTSSTAEQTRPSIGFDSVVYEDNRNGNLDIYETSVYDFTERRITRSSKDQRDPARGDGVVAYEDNRNGNWDIYIYDLWANTEKRLTSGSSSQVDPDASARRIVWTDKTSGRDDIYFYEMRFGTTHNLTRDTAKQAIPDISGGKITYLQSGAIKWASLRYPGLTVSAPDTVGYYGRATISGRLRTDTGSCIAGRRILVQRSTDQMNWRYVTTLTTARDGSYRYRTGPLTSRAYYRVTYKGGDTYLSARNWTGQILPRVYLTRPSGPISMSTGGFTSYGYLRPRHTAGRTSVAITTYRKENGVWVYKRTFWATNQDYSSYTRYRGVVQLAERGEWRIRARHADSVHATTYSSWRYITVR